MVSTRSFGYISKMRKRNEVLDIARGFHTALNKALDTEQLVQQRLP